MKRERTDTGRSQREGEKGVERKRATGFKLLPKYSAFSGINSAILGKSRLISFFTCHCMKSLKVD